MRVLREVITFVITHFLRARRDPRSCYLRRNRDWIAGDVSGWNVRVFCAALLCGLGNAGADQCRAGPRKKEERTVVVSAVDISRTNRDADIGTAAKRVNGCSSCSFCKTTRAVSFVAVGRRSRRRHHPRVSARGLQGMRKAQAGRASRQRRATPPPLPPMSLGEGNGIRPADTPTRPPGSK